MLSPSLGSCATMLFLGSMEELNVSDTAAAQIAFVIQRPPVNQLLGPDNPQAPVRKLVISWLLQCPNKSDDVLRQRLNVISATGLTDALPLALEIVSNDPKYLHVQPLTKALALLVIGQHGGREHIERLEPLLEDSSVCLPLQIQVPGQPAVAVQVRDVALAVLLTLTDQSPADYGYTNVRMATPRTFQLQSLHRENDQQRAQAVAKRRNGASHK